MRVIGESSLSYQGVIEPWLEAKIRLKKLESVEKCLFKITKGKLVMYNIYQKLVLTLFIILIGFTLVRSQQYTGSTILDGGWKLWLDQKAEWKNDPLFLPPGDVSKMPYHAPTCGWGSLFTKSLPAQQAKQIYADASLSMDVSVPGTVEQYFWDAVSGSRKGLGNTGDYIGVSWWGRDFKVPQIEKGKRVKLFFSEGVRQRAEVYINQKLVGYELIHQTPFDLDITDYVNYGASNKLAVRLTDPSGNFSWGDYTAVEWGDYLFPLSHGFGGILGQVKLKILNAVHVSDVFVKNKPSLRDIDADIEINNESAQQLKGTIGVEIVEAWKHNAAVATLKSVYTASAGKFSVDAGNLQKVSISANVPGAVLWGIRDANLYNLVVTLKDDKGGVIDRYTQRFGFRFLSVVGYGTNARLFFNGKRTFLLSAISWGFWPENGIFPTPELARKHIQSALALGQNMLNFHRCQGNSLVLNMADEMGIMYYEEPGGYSSSRLKEKDPLLTKMKNLDLARQLNSQRFLRLVKRDRNHPSLVIYNMVNEPGWNPDEQAKKDMAAAHLLDPTRWISYGSGFQNPGKGEPNKLHMLPYDQTQSVSGFVDVHNAGNSPGVYMDCFYNSPLSFRRNERNENELFIWGEEGAIASPPQLELIQSKIARSGINGWDGADYRDWHSAYTDYIKNKGLARYYPSVTGLITTLGNIMYYEHGRLVENVRIADGADVNVLNGYEDMKNDNFSGAVDVYRNLKGDPKLISQYMKPLYVAVKLRDKIGHTGDVNLFDMFVINENSIPAGNYLVRARVLQPDGAIKQLFRGNVHVTGDEKFSDLVTEKVPVSLTAGKGYYKITATLLNNKGKELATGHDELFAVDWKSDRIGGKGAVLGGSSELLSFVKDVKKADVVAYKDNLPKLDYVVIGAIDQGNTFKAIPSFNYRSTDGKTTGLNLDYYRGKSFDKLLDKRISTAGIYFDLKGKLIPGYDILGESDFSLRWEGYIVSEVSGLTQFQFSQDDGAKVWIDSKLVVDSWTNGPTKIKTFDTTLEAGKAYKVKIEAYQATGTWEISLKWKQPYMPWVVDIPGLLKRVKEDGTNLVIIEDGENWSEQMKKLNAFPDFKVFHPAKTWVGSNFFVRKHPLFEDLPVNGGMNWEYQRIVMYDGPSHFGLYNMQGEEAVVSLVGGNSHLVSTSVGIVPYGKGKILFSSLDLVPNLWSDLKASAVPRKIFCNYLNWAAGH